MNSFFNKVFEAINVADVLYLCEQKVVEKQNLEYKSQSYEKNDEGTRELLRDITAIANSYGGYLLIGIDEDSEGSPTNVLGIENAEDERDRIWSILTACADPRIPGLQAKTINVSGKNILLFHVPKSHRAPHLITYKGLNQFWIRHDRQKSKMSVDEIRDQIVKTENLIRDIDAFIVEQRQTILSEIENKPYFVIGSLPVLRSGREIVDIKDPTLRQLLIEAPEQRDTGWSFNFEGYAQIRPTLMGLQTVLPNARDWKTLELHRTGYFQAKIAIDEHFCREGQNASLPSGQSGRILLFYPFTLAEFLVSYFRILKRLKELLGIEEDFIVFVSLFNVKDYGLKKHRPEAIGYQGGDFSIWRKQHLELPLIQCNLTHTADELGKELADRIWQGFGYDECPMFQNGILQV